MSNSRRLRRGIYLLPTLFTIGNLFCGYSSLVQSALGNLELAAALIMVAAILDGLDGRIARLTGTTSEFGLEFDSLADIVSFGVAPALLAYQWALHPLGRIGWMVAFLYVVCAAMRLARFNIRTTIGDKRFFAGLPSPMAGGALASIVFAFPAPPGSPQLAGLLALLVVSVATLMISRLRYRSFKELDLRNRRSYTYVLPMAAALVAIALHPQLTVMVLATAYLLSAPTVHSLVALTRTRATPLGSALDAPPAGESDLADDPALR